jgi:hypothetical protein
MNFNGEWTPVFDDELMLTAEFHVYDPDTEQQFNLHLDDPEMFSAEDYKKFVNSEEPKAVLSFSNGNHRAILTNYLTEKGQRRVRFFVGGAGNGGGASTNNEYPLDFCRKAFEALILARSNCPGVVHV